MHGLARIGLQLPSNNHLKCLGPKRNSIFYRDTAVRTTTITLLRKMAKMEASSYSITASRLISCHISSSRVVHRSVLRLSHRTAYRARTVIKCRRRSITTPAKKKESWQSSCSKFSRVNSPLAMAPIGTKSSIILNLVASKMAQKRTAIRWRACNRPISTSRCRMRRLAWAASTT